MLTPAEMFVLSRVDGVASMDQLCQLTGLPVDETFDALKKLASVGLIDLPDGLDEVDLDEELQKEIRDLDERLADKDFFQMLGLEAGADAKAIRRAYFKISKRFHPDRYYGKRLGPFKARLERIFVKISEAHEFLADAKRRASYEANLLGERQRGDGSPEGREAGAPPGEPATKPPKRVANAKAREFFEEGLRELRANDYTAAALALRRAIALDRDNLGYQQQYKAALQRAGESSAEEYVRLAKDEETAGRLDAAAALYERAARAGGRAEPHAEAAQFFLRIGRLIEAKGHAMRATQLDSDCAEWHLVLARVYVAAGFNKQARREAEIALHLDSASPAASLLEEIKAP